jgi:hypothetical protein
MKRTLLFIIIANFALICSTNDDRVLKLKKTSEQLKVDGSIEELWNKADSTEHFFQLLPYFGDTPTKRTVAKLLTNEHSLYCLIICYDELKNIENNTGTQDQYTGDIVSLMLDTFNDKKTAYKFAVSASGLRSDCRLLDDARNRDYSWDGIWFASSKVYEWGYVVEMEIPYKSIQYEENVEYWSLDFDRWIPSSKEDLYWCVYDRNEGQRVSKFGKLVFDNFNPSVKGLNLEIYPMGLSKAKFIRQGVYQFSGDAGLDVMYNPSPMLKLQMTFNPDFAQIEADPFSFNISRYESYYNEKRPFFTEGNEIFQASGRENNSGFYRPLELFYSRRIGKLLPDGNEVPLIFGTKAFGRLNDWEYGGFVALSGEKDYSINNTNFNEPKAYFGSARIKKQILENSSIGLLFVGKQSKNDFNGVLDIDGAIRTSDLQFSYQVARSIKKNNDGDYAVSFGLRSFSEKWGTLVRGRYVGEKFDIRQVGYVPWQGTANLTALTGPVFYFDDGPIQNILLLLGFYLADEKVDMYTDHGIVLVYNMQFKNNWGFEIDLDYGNSRDMNKKFDSYNISYSVWSSISTKWNANINGGYFRTYNFARNYLANYSWIGSYIQWLPMNILSVGTSIDAYFEGNPKGEVEDVTINTRPFFSITPLNDLNIRVYIDNVFVKSTQHIEQVIAGLLFSYSFSPKSWIYFALNDNQNRSQQFDVNGNPLPLKMHTTSRASVLKVKYLYYF